MSHTSGHTSEIKRRSAWTSAKLAVRTYAREPSESNADRVESALRQVRDIAAQTVDQQVRGSRLASKSLRR